MIIDEIINIIKESKNIGITYHTSPDGDAVGSALGLFHVLNKLDKNVYIMAKEEIPKTFKFLPSYQAIDSDVYKVRENTDCVIVLDCGNVERINAELDIENRQYTLVNIDHHLSNDMYGDINFVNSESSAVGEIIFEILTNLNVELDKNIATCLYTSILTDTGSFRYSSTSKRTHIIVSELIDKELDTDYIYRRIFDNKSFNQIRLYGKVIDTMELLCNNKVCFMYLTQDMLDALQLINEDSVGVISFGAKIDTCDVTVFAKQTDDGVKVSLRSKQLVDVRKIAEYFGGGGHTRASGFKSSLSIAQIKDELITLLRNEIEK